MQFFKFSLVVLLAFASTGLAQLFAPRSPDCTAVKYVVIDSYEVQLYDENIHGQGPTLRLFDKLPSPDCYRKQKKRVSLSARTDLYLRDSRTSLMIYDRGLFDFVYSFGKSLLNLTPFAFLSGALSIIECSLAIYNAATKDVRELDWPCPMHVFTSFSDPRNRFPPPGRALQMLCLAEPPRQTPSAQSPPAQKNSTH